MNPRPWWCRNIPGYGLLWSAQIGAGRAYDDETCGALSARAVAAQPAHDEHQTAHDDERNGGGAHEAVRRVDVVVEDLDRCRVRQEPDPNGKQHRARHLWNGNVTVKQRRMGALLLFPIQAM